MRRVPGQFGLLVVALCAVAGPARAEYPDHPIKVELGFGAGGGADILLRKIIPYVSAKLGQSLVVEYKLGAGGNLAMQAVVEAPADGYTLLMGTPGLINNPYIYEKVPFVLKRDFAPISLVGTVPNVLVVNQSLPVKNVQELVALAKSKPGKLTFASSGTGSSLHLVGELFKHVTGTDILHVPYKGGAPAMTDIVGGQVDMMFNVIPSALPLIQGGQLRALAVTSEKRSPSLPDVPTMAEAGFPAASAVTWNGLLAPGKTPPAIIDKLNKAIVEALNTPQAREDLAKVGQDLVTDTPPEFAAFLDAENAKWGEVIKSAGIKAE
ncbi:MAG: tripartite tricarboxylate transporter substrate binding protein [Alphaproteobacteria bacterium]|nr:tripartite tricarboxylate transporter substrate binding protein [Alphaproteobacteria bacterium]